MLCRTARSRTLACWHVRYSCAPKTSICWQNRSSVCQRIASYRLNRWFRPASALTCATHDWTAVLVQHMGWRDAFERHTIDRGDVVAANAALLGRTARHIEIDIGGVGGGAQHGIAGQRIRVANTR